MWDIVKYVHLAQGHLLTLNIGVDLSSHHIVPHGTFELYLIR